MDATTV